MEVVLVEYDTKTKASQDAAAVDAAKRATALATTASADDKEAASHARDATAMAVTVFVVDTWHQDTIGAMQHRAVARCGAALVLPPSDDKALAPRILPLDAPTAMSSSPIRPTSYVGAVLSTMGGSSHTTPLIIALLPPPSTMVDGPLQKACCRTQPLHRTGQCHHPCVPSPPDKVLPSYPHPTLEGLSTPTVPPKLLARATSCSGTPSLVPPLMVSSTPSLLPFTFLARYVYL
jgi:hypothetical protein